MPNRPEQHRIAESARLAVSQIWNEVGAVEELRRDYGEDLLVQTSLHGHMDASRLWVQVKGTKQVRATGTNRITIRLRADTVLHWARSADLLVLILWDTTQNIGWYMVPSGAMLHLELFQKGRDKVTLPINADAVFDIGAARRIAWGARLEHLARFVRSFRWQEQEVAGWEPENAHWVRDALNVAVIDGLIDLRILERTNRKEIALTEDFREMVIRVIITLARERKHEGKHEELDKDEYLETIALRSLVEMVAKVTECKTPLSLLENMSEAIKGMLMPLWHEAVHLDPNTLPSNTLHITLH